MKYIIIFLIIFITHFSCKSSLDYTLLEKKIIETLNSQKGDFSVAFKNLSNKKTILINQGSNRNIIPHWINFVCTHKWKSY